MSAAAPTTSISHKLTRFMQVLVQHRVLEMLAFIVSFSTVIFAGSLILQPSNLQSPVYDGLNEVVDVRLVGATLIALVVALALTLALRLRHQAQWPSLALTLLYGFIGIQVLGNGYRGAAPATFGIYTFATLVCLAMTLIAVFGEDEIRD